MYFLDRAPRPSSRYLNRKIQDVTNVNTSWIPFHIFFTGARGSPVATLRWKISTVGQDELKVVESRSVTIVFAPSPSPPATSCTTHAASYVLNITVYLSRGRVHPTEKYSFQNDTTQCHNWPTFFSIITKILSKFHPSPSSSRRIFYLFYGSPCLLLRQQHINFTTIPGLKQKIRWLIANF